MQMHRTVVAVGILYFVAVSVMAQPPALSPDAVEQSIRDVIRLRFDAYARGDGEMWSRLVADDCLCASTTKAAILADIHARPSAVKTWFGEIEALQVRRAGDTAIVRYRIREFIDVAGQRIEIPEWRVETYTRRESSWLLIGGADSSIPVDPAIANVDPKVYDTYVGQYEYGPGVVDTVTREGNRLMIQPMGLAKEELFPQTETTYFGRGQDWRIIFVHDQRGRVTEVRFRHHEQDMVGKRIR